MLPGFVAVLAGLLAASPGVVRAGGLFYLAGALVFAVNIALLLTGRRSPERRVRGSAA